MATWGPKTQMAPHLQLSTQHGGTVVPLTFWLNTMGKYRKIQGKSGPQQLSTSQLRTFCTLMPRGRDSGCERASAPKLQAMPSRPGPVKLPEFLNLHEPSLEAMPHVWLQLAVEPLSIYIYTHIYIYLFIDLYRYTFYILLLYNNLIWVYSCHVQYWL